MQKIKFISEQLNEYINEKTFSPDRLLDLFTMISEIHQIFGVIFKLQLRMTASLISDYNQERLINGQISSMKKQNEESNIYKVLESQTKENTCPNINTVPDQPKFMSTLHENIPSSLESIVIQNQSISTSKGTNKMSLVKELNQVQEKPVAIKKMFKRMERKIRDQKQRVEANQTLCAPKSCNKSLNQPQYKQTNMYQFMPNQTIEPQRYFKNTVKGQDGRNNLPGHFCQDCQGFVEAILHSDKDKLDWCKNCSKHRGWNSVLNQDINVFKSPY